MTTTFTEEVKREIELLKEKRITEEEALKLMSENIGERYQDIVINQVKKNFVANKFSRNRFEKWTDIEGYLGWYKISTSGKIWSAFTDKIIKSSPHVYTGYLKVRLKNPSTGKQDTHYLHRLVATTFIPNPEDKPEVNHNDGNKGNCTVYNLSFMTREENMRHAQMHGLGNVKLKPIEVKSIYYMCWATDISQQDIADMYGVSRGLISAIKNRTAWEFITDSVAQTEMGLFE